jgi:hypothetical protein
MSAGCGIHRITVPTSPTRSAQSGGSALSPTNAPQFEPRREATTENVRFVEHRPRPDRHFRTVQKLNPGWWFANADDPVPPDWYRTGKRFRALSWGFRNPCHNFTFYVMGIADKPFVRKGPHPARISRPGGGWTWAVNCYKYARLPFVDYSRGRFEFYLGWRTAGNFGVKLNLRKRPSEGGRR